MTKGNWFLFLTIGPLIRRFLTLLSMLGIQTLSMVLLYISFPKSFCESRVHSRDGPLCLERNKIPDYPPSPRNLSTSNQLSKRAQMQKTCTSERRNAKHKSFITGRKRTQPLSKIHGISISLGDSNKAYFHNLAKAQ